MAMGPDRTHGMGAARSPHPNFPPPSRHFPCSCNRVQALTGALTAPPGNALHTFPPFSHPPYTCNCVQALSGALPVTISATLTAPVAAPSTASWGAGEGEAGLSLAPTSILSSSFSSHPQPAATLRLGGSQV